MARMEPIPEMYIGEGPFVGRWGWGREVVPLVVPLAIPFMVVLWCSETRGRSVVVTPSSVN